MPGGRAHCGAPGGRAAVTLPAAHERVLDLLGAEIVAGTHPPGAALTLDGVRERFAVSRTVAREAMRVLEHLALVTPRRRVGLVVRPRSDWQALDPRVLGWRLAGPGAASQQRAVEELRAAVLPAAAGACARHADTAELDRVGALATTLGADDDPDRLLAAHDALLRAVLDAAHNELLAATAPAVLPPHADRARRAASLAEPAVRDRHAELAAAGTARDVAGARAAMSALLTAVDAR